MSEELCRCGFVGIHSASPPVIRPSTVAEMIQACEDDFAAETAEDSIYASSIGGEQEFITGLRVKTAAGSFLTWHERARLVAAYNLMNATSHEDRMRQSLALNAIRTITDCQTIWLQRREREQSEHGSDPLVAKMRERGMSDEQILAALNANREL